jgi:hypothetical protein
LFIGLSSHRTVKLNLKVGVISVVLHCREKGRLLISQIGIPKYFLNLFSCHIHGRRTKRVGLSHILSGTEREMAPIVDTFKNHLFSSDRFSGARLPEQNQIGLIAIW